MSFAPETENIVELAIKKEYENACKLFGDKYHSLHEGYAILLEEVEEAIEEMKELINNKKRIWYYLKDYDPNGVNVSLAQSIGFAEGCVENAMKELAQVGAVLMKIENTISEMKIKNTFDEVEE